MKKKKRTQEKLWKQACEFVSIKGWGRFCNGAIYLLNLASSTHFPEVKAWYIHLPLEQYEMLSKWCEC